MCLLPKTTNDFIETQATPWRCSLQQWKTQIQEASKTKQHWGKFIKSSCHWALLGPRAILSCEWQISNLWKSLWYYLVSSDPSHTFPNPGLKAEIAFFMQALYQLRTISGFCLWSIQIKLGTCLDNWKREVREKGEGIERRESGERRGNPAIMNFRIDFKML